jgi:hypothetical protein
MHLDPANLRPEMHAAGSALTGSRDHLGHVVTVTNGAAECARDGMSCIAGERFASCKHRFHLQVAASGCKHVAGQCEHLCGLTPHV